MCVSQPDDMRFSVYLIYHTTKFTIPNKKTTLNTWVASFFAGSHVFINFGRFRGFCFFLDVECHQCEAKESSYFFMNGKL